MTVFSPRASHASGVRSRFPVLVRSGARLFSFRFQTLSCQSSPVKHLLPPALHSRLSCCYRQRTCLAPSLLRLLPSSAVSCRCLPVGWVPVARRLRCLLVYTCLSLVGSSLVLASDQVSFRPSRRAFPPFSLLERVGLATLGLCVADGSR